MWAFHSSTTMYITSGPMAYWRMLVIYQVGWPQHRVSKACWLGNSFVKSGGNGNGWILWGNG